MADQIPLTDDAAQTFRVNLGGQAVRLTVWWSPTTEGWYVSLAWQDRRSIIRGARLTDGGLPLDGIVTDFVGGLYVDGEGDLGREAWLGTHRLLYVTLAELAAAE